MQPMQESKPNWEVLDRYKVQHAPDSIHNAAAVGDMKSLAQFVEKGMRMGMPEAVTLQERNLVLGMMPIHVAADAGQLETVEYLIKRRIDVDAGDFFRVSSMHLAAIEDNYEICRVLIASRAAVALEDSEGDTPMHWAATKGHSQIIKLLSTHKAPVDPKNKAGWTPLHRAAYNNRKDAVLSLFNLGANLNAKNNEGNTALHLACFMNHLGMVEHLLGAGARMNERNSRDQTPYMLTIAAQQGEGARELMDKMGYARVMEGDAQMRSEAAAAVPEAAAVRAADDARAAADADARAANLASELSGLDAFSKPKPRRPLLKNDFPDGLTDSFSSDMQPDSPAGSGPTGVLNAGSIAFLSRALSGAAAMQPPSAEASAVSSAVAPKSAASVASVDVARRTSGMGAPLSAPRFVTSGNPSGPSVGKPPARPVSAVPGADQHQDAVRQANRAKAAAGTSAAGTLSSTRTSGSGTADRSSAGSVGNKAFLAKYQLDKHNLFAPS